ncbi:MAG: putative baseplate assembly protein, partial [bacterium]
ATELLREGFGAKKKDFPHTPDPGDLLLIVDASGVELVTVAQASGVTITLTQPLVRAMRPVAHAFDPDPTIRYFFVDPNDPATHRTTLRPVLLGELSGVYVGGNTVLALEKSVDAFAAGDIVALGDGTTHSAHRIVLTESVDTRTRLTLEGAAPTGLKVAFMNVYGAFEHAMHVADYDRSDGTIPVGTTQLDIDGAPVGLSGGQTLLIADSDHAEGLRVTQVQPLSNIVRVSLANPLDFSYSLADAVVYGNVAEVTHGASAPDEVLGSGDPTLAPQRFDLRRTPLAWIADPAAPRGVSPAVEIFVTDERWTLVDTLANSGPLDRHYVIQIDDRDRATVAFGDGTNGAPPMSGRNNIVARYRAGRGESANVGAGAINKMVQPTPYLDRTVNPAAASGGAEPEVPAQAKRNAALHARTLDRAVSLSDYADLALTFTGIAKARADVEREGRGAGARRLIVVTCAALGGNALSTPQKEALLAFLRARAPEPDSIRVRDHRKWPIHLALSVTVFPNFQQSVVQRALLDAFGNGENGFFSFDSRELGTAMALSSVYALAEQTPGVDNTLATLFHLETDSAAVLDRIPVPADAIASGGDADDASIGILSLHLTGGLP